MEYFKVAGCTFVPGSLPLYTFFINCTICFYLCFCFLYMEVVARLNDVVDILNMVLYGPKSDRIYPTCVLYGPKSDRIYPTCVTGHKVIYMIILIIKTVQLSIITSDQRQCYGNTRIDNSYHPDVTNIYSNGHGNGQKDVFLKQITTADIGPEGDNQYRTLGCKLDSDWLKFHSIGVELTTTRSFTTWNSGTVFNVFLWFIAIFSDIFSILMVDYLLWGSLDVFPCVGIALPWLASGEGRQNEHLLVKMTHSVYMEMILCCNDVFWGAPGWPFVSGVVQVLWPLWDLLDVYYCYLKCKIFLF